MREFENIKKFTNTGKSKFGCQISLKKDQNKGCILTGRYKQSLDNHHISVICVLFLLIADRG